MAKISKDIRDEILEAVEEEFEGIAESFHELYTFVDNLTEEKMDEHDVDLDVDDVMKEVKKHVTLPRPMETVCHECGDPDCQGCS